PQIAEPIFIHYAEPIAGHAWRIALVEDGEAHAIKAHQPVIRRQPYVTVARLHNAVHRVLRQTIVSRPVIETVLSVGRRRPEAQREQPAQTNSCAPGGHAQPKSWGEQAVS